MRWDSVLHLRAVAGLLLIGGHPLALAQSMPDSGRVLQDVLTQPQERPPNTLPPIQVPDVPKPVPRLGGNETRVQVTSFSFSGNSALSQAQLQEALLGWQDRLLNFGELIQAVEAVEARYKQAGYFLAQAYLPPQKIRDGVIEININEGRLGETRLEGESRIAPEVIYAYLDRLPRGEALTLAQLERQVLLINDLAGGHASLDLQAGETAGSTDVVLIQRAENLIAGRLEANNHGAPSTGERRYGLTLNANSPAGLGERISLNILGSETGNLSSYHLRGELPVGNDGWRISMAASRAEYTLGGAFAANQASGQANSLRAGVSYPLLRSRNSNLNAQLEVDQSRLSDRSEADTSSELNKLKHSHGLTLTLRADHLDQLLGGGSSRADLTLRAGQLSLSSPASNADPLQTAGHFHKYNLALQRQQFLSKELSVQAQLAWQRAGKNLDSSEKLALGGATTLPGYASGEASGDAGTHFKLGLRWQASAQLALTAFADQARLTLARAPLVATKQNYKRMADRGLSADWQLNKNFTANLVVAWAGSEPPNPNDNDRPRTWFSLGYAW